MIQVKNIEGSAESIPEFYILIFSDDNYFYFLETDDEVTKYNSLIKPIVVDGMLTEGAKAEDILALDPRNGAEYYKVREEAGKALVRLVSDMLLKDIKSGVRSFADTMAIEEKLDKTMDSLNTGQLLTAKYKMSLTQNLIPSNLFLFIFTEISNLCKIHYAS